MDGISHKGFAVIEVLSPCPVIYGRRNRMSVEDMYFWLRDNTLPVKAWEKLPEEKREGKIPRGVLHHTTEREEYTEVYWKRVEKLSGGEK
jgi:2-oxoglutarate ferredoxin oxidoreductase subunit beta